MKKILFSLVGKTDPVSNYYDGPLLHLCRYLRPDIVYLYISAEFMPHHRKDDRYRKTIQLLGEQIHHEFEIHAIERTDLKEAHVFDLFYDDFENELESICRQHAGEIELYLNLSQGTPAMKSALYVVAALADMDVKLMQVSSPERSSTLHYDLPEEYSIEDYWEVDQDNQLQEQWESSNDQEKIGLKNPVRMFLVQNASFHMRIQKEIIMEMIRSYDYEAAFLVANGINKSIPSKAFTLLEAAKLRLSLKQELCTKKLKSIGYGNMIPYVGEEGQIYEYALMLSIKLKRQEYLEFIRGMTPLLFTISSLCVKKKLNIQINDFCKEKNKTLFLDRSILEASKQGIGILHDIETDTNRYYTTMFLSENQLIALIQQRLDNSMVKDNFKLLYTIEKQVRNPAAHKIVALSEQNIQDITGYSPKEILSIFKKLLKYLGFSTDEREWNSYEHMNQEILNLLNILPQTE